VSGHVVCVGLATRDTILAVPRHPAADELVLASDVAIAGGGPAATAAVTLARLGVSACFVGAVGDDETGAFIRAGLESEGVDVSELAVVPGRRSPESAIYVGRGTRAIAAYRGDMGPPSLTPRAEQLCRQARWVHVDQTGYGSVPRDVRLSIDAGNPVDGLDLAGTALSALGLGLVVFSILRAGTWGFVIPKPGVPDLLRLSPAIWMFLAGGVVLLVFVHWEAHVAARGRTPLVDLDRVWNPTLRSGLTSFFFQYLVQAGLFFAVPLFLSVALGLSAIATGVRLLPLSVTLLVAAVGVPRFLPSASPRRVAQAGFLALLAGIVVLIVGLQEGAGAEITTVPMLLAGLGVGALASQLGAVTVSSVPDELSGEVGGLQNTLTNLGASIGTALAGAVLISALTSSVLAGLSANADVPDEVAEAADVELASGVPFTSDKDLVAALDDAGVPDDTADAIVEENEAARLDALRAALGVLAVVTLLAAFASRRLPIEPPGAGQPSTAAT
jgi:hypothetical protein